MTLSRFARYNWAVLIYNIGVVLWGAYVRATGSGAGCGSHWPLCGGTVIPRSQSVETLIEFSHRLTSGVTVLLIGGLVVWAWRAYPKGHAVRLGAGLSGLFTLTEALVGAGLVLFGFTAQNAAAIPTSIHLVNTFLLLGSLALTGLWASGGRRPQLSGQGNAVWLLGLALLGVLVLGVTGAITALGDTLFPSSSLAQGLRDDFSPGAHFLIRLRVLHPIIAVSVAAVAVGVVRYLNAVRPARAGRRLGASLTALVAIQLIAGAANVVLMAPVWMQLLHLLLADLLWITLVLFAGTQLAAESEPMRSGEPRAAAAGRSLRPS